MCRGPQTLHWIGNKCSAIYKRAVTHVYHALQRSSLSKQQTNAPTSLPACPGGPCRPFMPSNPLSPKGPWAPGFPEGPVSPWRRWQQRCWLQDFRCRSCSAWACLTTLNKASFTLTPSTFRWQSFQRRSPNSHTPNPLPSNICSNFLKLLKHHLFPKAFSLTSY